MTSSLYANAIYCNASHIVGGQERDDSSEPLRVPFEYKDWKNPFYHIYECKDGRWFLLLGGSYGKLQQTLRAVGLEDLVGDERFANHYIMQKNSSILYDRMEEVFRKKTSEEWKAIMQELDIPYEIVATNTEVTQDEQAWANGYLTKMICPDGRTYVVPNTPVSFSGVERADTKHAGCIGSNTTEVLMEHGYTAQQVQDMLDRGIAK